MTPETLLGLIVACAPSVHPTTMQRIVAVESGGNPLALNINGEGSVRATSLDDAVTIALDAIRRGASVDIGLAQINSRNLPRLGLDVASVLDPCTNLKAGQVILSESYERALQRGRTSNDALIDALSEYNTGSPSRGVRNGYVGRVVGNRHRRATSASNSQMTSAAIAAFTAPTSAYTRVSQENIAMNTTPQFQTTGLANRIAGAPATPAEAPLRLSEADADRETPGVQRVVSPEEAELLGAFAERAVSEEAAWGASVGGEDSHE